MTSIINQHRKRLDRTFEQLAKGQLCIGLLGGSITAPAPHNWSEPVIGWLTKTYPEACITVENAAIGSTNSEMAVFRAQRDIIERNCDLIFVEYAVNDNNEPADKRMRTREGLLRRLLTRTDADIVLVYTYHQDMYDDMMKGLQPPSIAGLELLGEHYRIGSVWMSMHALNEVRSGGMSWEAWLPDGLHPQDRGSYSYARSVIHFLQAERERLASPAEAGSQAVLPAPLNAGNWEHTRLLDWREIERTGPWTVRRRRDLASLDQALFSSAPGASLRFAFEGRGLTFATIFGKYAAEFSYRLDGGEWLDSNRDRSGWCPDKGHAKMFLVSDELQPGVHTFELRTKHGNGPNCKGTNFELLFIGIIQ